jgi:hypothetical protein
MIVTFLLKLGTFFINYFGKLDTLINTLAYVRHFDILCINKLCQIDEDAYVYYQPMKKSHNHLKSPDICTRMYIHTYRVNLKCITILKPKDLQTNCENHVHSVSRYRFA